MLKKVYLFLMVLFFLMALYQKDYPWAIFAIIFLGIGLGTGRGMENWRKNPSQKILYLFSRAAYILSALLFIFKNEVRISSFTHSPLVLAVPLCFFLPNVYFLWQQKNK